MPTTTTMEQRSAVTARARHVGRGVAIEVLANCGRFSARLPPRFAMWAARETADQTASCLGADREASLATIVAAYAEVADR